MVGAPNQTKDYQVQWHTPSPAALSAMAGVLRSVVVPVLGGVVSDLDATSAGGNGIDAAASKKMEESVQQRFVLLTSALRGAAEVLGDTPTASVLVEESAKQVGLG